MKSTDHMRIVDAKYSKEFSYRDSFNHWWVEDKMINGWLASLLTNYWRMMQLVGMNIVKARMITFCR